MITERVYKDRAYGPKTDGSISMFINFFLLLGKYVPISFLFIAPKRASIIACIITSPSE